MEPAKGSDVKITEKDPGSDISPPEASSKNIHTETDIDERNMDAVMDLPLTLSVELGRSKILVSELIQLHKGSVVELDKLAGEALEILVNGKVIAKGEVVIVNEKFGIRLTEVISHGERIRQLGK